MSDKASQENWFSGARATPFFAHGRALLLISDSSGQIVVPVFDGVDRLLRGQ